MDRVVELRPCACTMEKFYAEHVCFVTGATGFVGKVLVEKLLRWQPTGPLIYVLIRPRQDESATDRLHREVRLLFSLIASCLPA